MTSNGFIPKWIAIALAGIFVTPATMRASSPVPTVATLTLSASSVPAGTPVTLRAGVVAGGAAVSPGLVLFCDATAPHCTDIHILGQAQLTTGGIASVKLRLRAGEHSVRAEFQGTHLAARSVSSVQTLTVTGKSQTHTNIFVDHQTFYAGVESYGSNSCRRAGKFHRRQRQGNTNSPQHL